MTKERADTLLSPRPQVDDTGIAVNLRPKNLSDYVGQQAVIQKLSLMLEAARARQEPVEHVLFHGPPGLGKTSLAHVVAAEMGARVVVTSGPALERAGDLAAILTSLKARDILFIDEIHRLPKIVEEMLYPAMEDFRIDLVIGQGPMARTAQMMLQRFTLIGATTRAGLMSTPLRDRFGAAFRLSFYDEAALATIVTRTAERLKVVMDTESARLIATRARGTPRIANRLVRRVRDYRDVHAIKVLGEADARAALTLFEIDDYGCDPMDRTILQTIIHKYGGGPVGIETIASSLSEDAGTIEDFYEPYLIQLGFIQRTARGRVATRQAYVYLGVTPPSGAMSDQSPLF